MAWVSPRTWSAEAATAAKMNEISSALDVLGATTWQSYIPVWSSTGTAPDIGNGSITGYYIEAGGWCEAEIMVAIGSSTAAGTGTYTLSLPVTGIAPARTVMGSALVVDNSAPDYYMLVPYSAGGGTTVGLASTAARWAATAPVAPASGDTISVKLRYRI